MTPAPTQDRPCRDRACWVPEPHRHRPPTPAEFAESRSVLALDHLPQCAWRLDIYDGCSCGLTQAITDLYTLGAVVR